MRSARLTSLVILAGLVAGALLLDAAEDPTTSGDDLAVVAPEAGVAIPAARPEPTLASTWYCAGGTAAAEPDGLADHVLILLNPTDEPRQATVTVLAGEIAPAPPPPAQPGETTTAPETTTTEAPTTTERPAPTVQEVELPAQTRVSVRLGDVAPSELAGAVVEVDGGEIAVEHQVSGERGRATAPCSTAASPTWSLPWGVTARGARELVVFMNPFPDDATIDIAFATDEGMRDTARFQGFVVPGRSVVGAYIDEDVTRREQVSAHITARSGRVVVDRIQTFDGTDAREGITLGLGVPTPALTWVYPLGDKTPGVTEQVVVFNPTEAVAEVEVEVRLDDPDVEVPPEPFELTVPPGRYSLVDLSAEERVPPEIGHAIVVRSLNGVPVAAERVVVAADPSPRRGVSAVTGSPIGARTWYFPGGGPTGERDQYLVLLNLDDDSPVSYRVTGVSRGQTIAIQGLQDGSLEPGARAVIRLGDHLEREDLSVVVTADGPVAAERALYHVGGLGISTSMGIPLATDVFVPEPIAG